MVRADDEWLVNSCKEVFATIPEQTVRDGGAVDWGSQGAKARALYLAALMGHHYDQNCKSCESDLYYVVKTMAK